jgi:hypothetical protein
MAIPTRIEPGAAAPVTGVYQELNVFGTPTGRQTIAQEGEQLPHAPIMFSWRLKSSADGDPPLQKRGAETAEATGSNAGAG